MINDKLINKSIYLHPYDMHKCQTEPRNYQCNFIKVGPSYRTLLKQIEQGEYGANK